jgi:hypothetical protein
MIPWSERERVIGAGYVSGRDVNKSELLGFSLRTAEKLTHTRLVDKAEAIFELVVYREITNISREFAPFVMDVVYVHGKTDQVVADPILYLSQESFAPLGETWVFRK